MLRRSQLALLLLLAGCQEPVLSSAQQEPIPSASVQPITVPNQASLGGIVRERESGKLIAGAAVRLDTRSTVSDQAGFYQFLNPGSGQVKLIVMHPDYAPFAETLTLDGQRRIVDVQLSPAGTPVPTTTATPSGPAASASPTGSPPPLILQPDGSVTTPSPSASVNPSASPTASPSASPSGSASPTPSPSPSGAYDPVLDEAAQAEVLVKRRSNGLELVFTLQRANGTPVNWQWGQIKVEYFVAKTSGPAADSLITSGRSVINSNGDSFVVTTGQAQTPETVRVKFTLTLPDDRLIEHETTVQVSG